LGPEEIQATLGKSSSFRQFTTPQRKSRCVEGVVEIRLLPIRTAQDQENCKEDDSPFHSKR